MKNIVIIGNGFIASHLPYKIDKRYLQPNKEAINKFIDEHKPDVIINCIGKCGGSKTIDWCKENKSATYMSNVVIPLMIANECEKLGIHFAHISSGCCFFGKSPNEKDGIDIGWKEDDIAIPLSYYSKTKYYCDQLIGSLKNVVALRIRMPISYKNHSRNLLKKLISYQKVVDVPNSMTFMNDLIRALNFVIEKEKVGIYHITSPQPLKHSELLEEYKKYVADHKYDKITPEELDNIVADPRSNCIINCDKIISEGFEFDDTNACVREYMKAFIFDLKGNI